MEDFDNLVRCIMDKYLSKLHEEDYFFWNDSFYKLPGGSPEIIEKLRSIGSPVIELYDQQSEVDSSIDDLIEILNGSEVLSNTIKSMITRLKDETIQYELKAMFHWVFSQEGMTPTKIASIIGRYFEEHMGCVITKDGRKKVSFIVSKPDVEVVRIESLSGENGYLREIERLQLDDKHPLFYRGHSDLNYVLQTSLERKKEYADHEDEICFDVVSRCPEDFIKGSMHLQTLAKMQHFGVPTRLLDLTTNPLVALYFACENTSIEHGEVIVLNPDKEMIKNAHSDTVTILASLHRFSKDDKEKILRLATKPGISIKGFNQENIIKRLLQVIKVEKPAFMDSVNPKDLLQDLVVYPIRDNPRLIRQDGIFAIRSLPLDNGVNNMRFREVTDNEYKDKGSKIILHITNKSVILKELNLSGINKASLFPDITNIAQYICERFT